MYLCILFFILRPGIVGHFLFIHHHWLNRERESLTFCLECPQAIPFLITSQIKCMLVSENVAFSSHVVVVCVGLLEGGI